MQAWEKFKKDFAGKKILIMGFGLHGGGAAVAEVFSKAHCQITITDLKPKKRFSSQLKKLSSKNYQLVFGKHQKKDFTSHDLVIRNPGVPQDSPYLNLAREKKIPIKMEATLFAKYTQSFTIGVTGTRGKSTTAALIYQILKSTGKEVFIGGNIPRNAALSLLPTAGKNSLVVLELSSWQLQGFAAEKISPNISIVTNIYPDHLNRYKSMDEYVNDKMAIVRYQKKSDHLVINEGISYQSQFTKNTPAKLHVIRKNSSSALKLIIPGEHNRQNAALSLEVANILNIPRQSAAVVINSFKGLPYRLEMVANINDRTIINDTTSTTPTATIVALKSISSPLVLVLGGQSKNLPVDSLAHLINQKSIPTVLLAGTGTNEIAPLIDKQLIIGSFASQDKAITEALKNTPKKGTLLFSPGFTSFGMYQNEFERGEDFNRSIKKIIENEG